MSKSHKKLGKCVEKKNVNCLEVFTGLPPQVDGQIRCFCTLSVPQVIWTVPKPPVKVFVRVKWWGETGDGVLFRPHDIKKGTKAQNLLTTAKYAVRSGPVQFTTYLNDMGSLKLDVLTAPNSDVYGQAQVPKIGHLTSSKPINGFFPVISNAGKKLANLQVALVLEPVAASEDSVDMIPTTDAGLQDKWTGFDTVSNLAVKQPTPHLDLHAGSQPDRSVPSLDLVRRESEVVRSGLMTSLADNKNNFKSSLGFKTPNMQDSQPETQGKDLLSVIVDRGMKLREAMVISSLPGDSQGLNKPDGFSPTKLQMALTGSPQSGSDFMSSPYRNMDFKSGYTSMSSDVSFDPALSMLADPMMDNSLLQDLFYFQTANDMTAKDPCSNGNQFYMRDPVSEQPISQPARLLGGSAQSQAEDPKEDMGNKRPPSRTSSLASLNLVDQDVNTNNERKRVKRKARSRSRSKSTTRSRSRSRSNSITGTESQSNTPTKSAKVKKKSSLSKENVSSLVPKLNQKDGQKAKKKIRSRSSSRSRSRSRSRKQRNQANVDDSSDFDLMSTARSEPSESGVCLNAATLKQLTKVHFAKINIEHLQFAKAGDLSDSIGKHKGSRPPKPQSIKKSGTYILEYHFPLNGSLKPATSDYITVPSQKVHNEAIVFQHTSSFPVVFDADTVEKWWRSALVFRLYHKDGHSSAVLVGSGGISLKSIMRSQNLSVQRDIEIADSRRKDFSNSSKSSALNTSITSFGQLKVSVVLASNKDQSDSQDWFDANRDQNFVKSIEKTLDIPVSSKAVSGNQRAVAGLPPQSPRPRPQNKLDTSFLKQQLKDAEPDSSKVSLPQADFATLRLHSLLLIQEGSGIGFHGAPPNHGGNPKTLVDLGGQKSVICNTYVICKMLWCKDAFHSDVCWETNNPKFNFAEVTPVLLTPTLLDRLKDNYIIIEVWDKKIVAGGDKLVGMVKLSLQQFYLSFRDRKIAKALLSSEYPVVALDNLMPVVDPFTGHHVGQLKVLLAMGSEIQVSNLKTITLGFGSVQQVSGKLQNQREDHGSAQNESHPVGTETHEFEVQIEGVNSLKLADNMIWGEADCFIQFFFPAQDEGLKERLGTSNGLSSLKCYRTVTTLCTPDATFHDTSVHKLILPVGVPVQRELLAACAKSSGSVSGLSFEVWCRYYQPNIRDQLIAKCTLPLAKLSAMITMHKPGEQCMQAFSLKLIQVGADTIIANDANALAKQNAGTLNFSITYRKQLPQAVGGLELTVKFSHQEDLDRVVRAARNVGWSSFDLPPEQMNWQEGDDPTKNHNITIVIDHVSFPTHLAVARGETTVNKAAKCYVRYKFYDKGAVVTKSGKLKTSERGLLVSTLNHRRDFTLSHTAPLQWYLREEKLEIQIWLTFGHDHDSKRSRQRDKWLGSCYIDLESLTEARRGRQRVSGLFPLFKPGTDNLKSAFVKADIVSRLSSGSKEVNSSRQNLLYDESESITETEQSMEDVQLWARNFMVDKTSTKKGEDGERGHMDSSFAVLMAIERAMHLPMVTERNRSGEVNPTTYVSYQSAERSKPTCTSVFPNSCNPLWDYAVETRLSTQYLHDSNKNLVLKVWHKPADAPKTPDKSCDKVLGFVSVDLGPLSKGLQQICGWYNILDFNGQCRGQIKVSISPQDLQTQGSATTSSFMLPLNFGTRPSSVFDSHTQTVADQLVSLQQQLKHWMASQTSNLFTVDTDSNAKGKPASSGLLDDSSVTKQNAPAKAEFRTKLDLTPVSDETPTSYLFSSLRRQLEDLDTMTQKMKLRLSTTSDSDTNQPPISSGRSADILNGTYSGISTINTASSLMNTREGYNNAESSENGAPHELSQSRTMNASTLEFPADASAEKSDQKGAVGPGRFLDSGVFSSKNFYDRSEDNEPDSQRSGRSVSTDPAAGQDSSHPSAHRAAPHPAHVESLEAGMHNDRAGKTQPFMPAGDSSETSGNSQGFMPDSQRANDTNTLTSLNFGASRSAVEAGKAGTSSDAVSTLGSKQSQTSVKSEGTVVEGEDEYGGDDDDDDDGKGHENSLYGSYHRYRALLDEEEDDADDADKKEYEDDVVEVIPRSLNNMSTVLALQARQQTLDLPEDFRSDKQDTEQYAAPHAGVHHADTSYCSADNEDSFFQEIVTKKTGTQSDDGEGRDAVYVRKDLDTMVDEVQQLQISDVENWLEKHMTETSDEIDGHQEGSDSHRTHTENMGFELGLREAEDAAEINSQRSAKERELATPREVLTPRAKDREQDIRLELSDQEDEHNGVSNIDAGGNVWRQDIQDSSDEETFLPQKDQRKQLDTSFDEEVDDLTETHEASPHIANNKSKLPEDEQMQCLSKVQLENSSCSGGSQRSMSSSTTAGRQNNRNMGSAVVKEVENDSPKPVHPSGFSYAQNPGFEYPFTLELEDLKIDDQNHNSQSKEPENITSGADVEVVSPPSPHSARSQSSQGSGRLDKTSDSWATREQLGDGSLSNMPREQEMAVEAVPDITHHNENNVDSTVDSAYVDSDGCHRSITGIDTSSKGAGSVYNFLQDDSGVGQLSRTISGESSQPRVTNFFMPAEDMEASMRILQSATATDTRENIQKNLRAQQKVLAASQLVTKLAERKLAPSSISVKNKKPPSAKEAKRIAKIFTSKAS
ncbi:C2 domain-containing protein 3 [Plakobranchus ocellatus]|uniref:C2 domain-containing protein 3 n=1 Tax=Plakobranchus ocellatus TaxID=259542 RepID=A0AAV3YRJ9_9GAST|nr:C2 domain-containing protein 3 [Plakobranchus ocellatus]